MHALRARNSDEDQWDSNGLEEQQHRSVRFERLLSGGLADWRNGSADR